MEFHDAFSEALIDLWCAQRTMGAGIDLWDFGPMYIMGGEL